MMLKNDLLMKFDLLDKLIVVGDRVLIKPKSSPDKTRSGLFLPPGYSEKEAIQSGYIVKCGPGYPIPIPQEIDPEPWKPQTGEQIRYLPLQAQVGDLAIFLQKGAIEVHFNQEKYFIVQHHAILLLERDDFQ
jgi:co-chaperonin GroES (HSP10)